jgi:hypothetical protein
MTSAFAVANFALSALKAIASAVHPDVSSLG